MLSDKQLQKVCLLGAGSRECRYLEHDSNDWRRFNCIKKSPAKKQFQDKSIKKYLDKCRASGVDPHSNYQAINDNCSGYLYMPSIRQGFDIDRKNNP